MRDIYFLTGKDCHLCTQARHLIAEVDSKKLNFIETDIYSKRIYVDKYWDKIPVLISKERELFWPFSLEEITNFLE